MSSYKEEKEAFVSGMTGSSLTHTTLVPLVALASVFLYAAIKTRLPQGGNIGLLGSWLLLVLPMLLSMTVYGERPLLLNLFLFIPGAALLFLPKQEGPSPLPSKTSSPKESDPRKTKLPPLPALTTYRAHMMLLTVIAILAVDFPIFPRSLAKCETFGISLMDLGVGSFVYSQGMVSAIPLLRDPRYLTSPQLPKLIRVTKKCLPVIALGVVRVIMVKGTEYPEHVTEYGVHWNFFITLALLPILQVLLHPLLIYLPISAVGILVALGHQFCLSQLGNKEYVLNAPRESLVSQNKEGIVSLSGYLAIHLLGLSAGTLVLPPSPSFFRRRQQALAEQLTKRRSSKDGDDHIGEQPEDLDPSAPRQLGKTATELCAYSILWWSLLFAARFLKVDGTWDGSGGVSRRMVNLPYIFWVAAYNISFVLAYIVVLDVFFFPGPKSKKGSKTPREKDTFSYTLPSTVLEGNPPVLLEAINNHSLPIFLIANLMTGLVNLSVKTMYASDTFAFFILSAYTLAICAVAWFWGVWSKGGQKHT